eukprot:31237-Pelagococcus_subviridis.AAC.12
MSVSSHRHADRICWNCHVGSVQNNVLIYRRRRRARHTATRRDRRRTPHAPSFRRLRPPPPSVRRTSRDVEPLLRVLRARRRRARIQARDPRVRARRARVRARVQARVQARQPHDARGEGSRRRGVQGGSPRGARRRDARRTDYRAPTSRPVPVSAAALAVDEINRHPRSIAKPTSPSPPILPIPPTVRRPRARRLLGDVVRPVQAHQQGGRESGGGVRCGEAQDREDRGGPQPGSRGGVRRVRAAHGDAVQGREGGGREQTRGRD